MFSIVRSHEREGAVDLQGKRFPWRTVPAIVAGLLVGAVLIQPAVAHLTTFAHLKDHFMVDRVFYRSETDTIAAGPDSFQSVEVVCPANTKVVAGGMNASAQGVELVQSRPTEGGGSFSEGTAAWRVNARNTTGAQREITAYAICLRAGNENTDF